MWRCDLSILNAHATVCCHHDYVLLKRFQMEWNVCCNPFKLHRSKRKGIRTAVQGHIIKKPLLFYSPVSVVFPHCQSNFVSFFTWCNYIKSVCIFITSFLKPVAEKLQISQISVALKMTVHQTTVEGCNDLLCKLESSSLQCFRPPKPWCFPAVN